MELYSSVIPKIPVFEVLLPPPRAIGHLVACARGHFRGRIWDLSTTLPPPKDVERVYLAPARAHYTYGGVHRRR